MSESENKRLVTAIAILAASFNRVQDDALFRAYDWGLEDIPIDDIETGVRRAIREWESSFMPTPAELRELAGVLNPASRGIIAFQAVKLAIKKFGGYQSVEFDDPVIHATILNLGGWLRVSNLDSEEFDKWFRRDFERVYVSLSKTGISTEQGRPLIGICDAYNRSNDFLDHVKPPVKIQTQPPDRHAIEGPSPPRRLEAAV